MSAPNFYIKNATRYFVADEQDTCELIDCFFDDMKDDLKEVARSIEGFDPCSDESIPEVAKQSMNDGCRDYYAVPLGVYCECRYEDIHRNVWWCIMYPFLRSGYWSGAVLDYHIQLGCSNGDRLMNEEVKDTASLVGLIERYADFSAEWGSAYKTEEKVAVAMNLLGLVKYAEDKFYEFAEASGLDEYAKAWQGSNGEAGYTNLSEIKRQSNQ